MTVIVSLAPLLLASAQRRFLEEKIKTMARPRIPKHKQKRIAKQHIIELFSQAEVRHNKDPKLANRYVHLARKIAMKVRQSIPFPYKRQFCKHCYSYLHPAKNARIRTSKGKVVIYCKDCKHHTRISYKRQQKEKRKHNIMKALN